MANEQNLIRNEDLTPSERRARASKAGKASGKARRRKADLKKAFEVILKADVQSNEARAQLESMGFEATNEMLLALSTFQQAAKGNQRAVDNIIKLTASKDKHDIAEQKEKIKALKIENELRARELETIRAEEQVTFVDDIGGVDDEENESAPAE